MQNFTFSHFIFEDPGTVEIFTLSDNEVVLGPPEGTAQHQGSFRASHPAVQGSNLLIAEMTEGPKSWLKRNLLGIQFGAMNKLGRFFSIEDHLTLFFKTRQLSLVAKLAPDRTIRRNEISVTTDSTLLFSIRAFLIHVWLNLFSLICFIGSSFKIVLMGNKKLSQGESICILSPLLYQKSIHKCFAILFP